MVGRMRLGWGVGEKVGGSGFKGLGSMGRRG